MRAITFSAVFVLVPMLASAQQPCTSDADSTVDAIYRQILERPAAGEGIPIGAIPFSAVFFLVPMLASAQQPCTSDADSTVDAIYRQILERPAAGEGNARAEQLRSGQTTVRAIVREVAKSSEHAQRFLPANNRTQAVTNLYRHVLGRSPDPEGLNSHV